jgi:hypothetical protein
LLIPGTKLGHYVILGPIGAGGMGEVYRARDDRLERDVALKVLPVGTLADEAARQRFRRRWPGQLNHPNIATVFDFWYAGRCGLSRNGAGRRRGLVGQGGSGSTAGEGSAANWRALARD